jgi:hypothetical protein
MKVRSLHSARFSLAVLSLALFALVAVFAGCGKHGATAPNLVPLTLKGGGTGVSAATALRAVGIIAAATDTQDVSVTFTTALLNVRDVRFKTSFEGEEDTTGTDGASGELSFTSADTDTFDAEDEEGEGMIVFRGPFLIDLLTQHAAELDEQLVPPGTYRRVQGHLQGVHGEDAGASGRAAMIGSTVFLEGTISGEGGGPFSYEARIDDEFQIRGDFDVAENTPATAFITFDVSRWLVDREGHFLDPRDPANDLAIKSAIRHSIKVEMDDGD